MGGGAYSYVYALKGRGICWIKHEVCIGKNSLYCTVLPLSPGLLVLKELGIEIQKYVASEIDPDSVKVVWGGGVKDGLCQGGGGGGGWEFLVSN